MQMQHSGTGDRGDDASRLKREILRLIFKCRSNPADKAGRGFNDAVLAQMLCSMGFDIEDPEYICISSY